MVSYEEAKELLKKGYKEFEELQPIVEEAEKAERLIMDTWLFKVGEHEVMVWKDERNKIAEFMNHDGSWKRNVAGAVCQTVKCDAATIFEHFYAEYVHNEKRPCALEDKKTVRMAETCGYFREFLKQTEDEHDHMTK